ncbi:unnamed protein product [Adineta ricciae]|uniref:ZZ-type domain-containing protein n=1 Tax=Adineta ricciae TaxID=249248 RepID=A0A814UUV4_ADIRI|nr:unnamed protein product [Adineta ricciae]CAF1180919.1 unnamed protein product [Adineta ricciae]
MMNARFSNELQQLQMELRAQNFDLIRFSTYRTACKLRFIQKRLNFHLLDLINVVEALREAYKNLSFDLTSANTTPIKSRTPSFLPNSDKYLSVKQLTGFLTSIYTNLNKRLPISQQIHHIDNCVHSAIAWLLYVYNAGDFIVSFNSFRVVLILLCSGKLIDKLRHLFTSCFSTSLSNTLTHGQIDELLHEILALPYALQEISHSTYCTNYARLLFSQSSSITLDEFLQMLIYQNRTPNCLQWLIIFYRLISVENVIHRVKCSACQRPSFSGFRYKCQQCHNRTYQLCQDCFWRGRTSEQHLSTHEMKEYTYFTPPNKDFRQSIRKSLKCMPKNNKRYQFSSSLTVDREQQSSEHRDISLYTKQLASAVDNYDSNSPDETRFRQRYTDRGSAEKKLLISKLEAENRRILHEIKTLRAQLKYRSLDYLRAADQDVDVFCTIDQEHARKVPHHTLSFDDEYLDDHYHTMRPAGSAETAMNRTHYAEDELETLLARKDHLESRIDHLRQSREEVTAQLDHLGRILHTSSHIRQRSATTSPHNRSTASPWHTNSLQRASKKVTYRSYSTPATPVHHQFMNHLRTDLLLAADSLTSALSTLVQHLNTNGVASHSAMLSSEKEFDYCSHSNNDPAMNDDYLVGKIDNDERLFYSTSIDEKI